MNCCCFFNDYFPYGMLLNNRHGSVDSDSYRYGFNGKEKDDEVKGSGAQYDYGFRIYDARLGKFLSQDPLFKSFPFYTPYQFAGNKPIAAADLDGLEEDFKFNVYESIKEATRPGTEHLSQEEVKRKVREGIAKRKFMASAPDEVVALGVGLGLVGGFGYAAAGYFGISSSASMFGTMGVNLGVQSGLSYATKGDLSGIDGFDVITSPIPGGWGIAVSSLIDVTSDGPLVAGASFVGLDEYEKGFKNTALDVVIGTAFETGGNAVSRGFSKKVSSLSDEIGAMNWQIGKLDEFYANSSDLSTGGRMGFFTSSSLNDTGIYIRHHFRQRALSIMHTRNMKQIQLDGLKNTKSLYEGFKDYLSPGVSLSSKTVIDEFIINDNDDKDP